MSDGRAPVLSKQTRLELREACSPALAGAARFHDGAGDAGLLSRTRSNPMCDYSLHAMATRPAEVGETVVTTTFRGTSTRGFASEKDLSVAVCMLPGTELAFADDVKYDSRWIGTRTINCRVG